MAIKDKDYRYLWDDIKTRKGKHIDKIVNEYIEKMGFEIPHKLQDKAKWLMYRLDQDVRSFMFKYVEVIEKSLISLLASYDETYLDSLLEKIDLSMTEFYFLTINKVKNHIVQEKLQEKLDKIGIKQQQIDRKFIKDKQKEMNIFQGDVFLPSGAKFQQIVRCRNKIQHFDFILYQALYLEYEEFKYFFDVFNLHYRHSFALNFLSMILKRFTTDFDNIAIQMMRQYSWLFEYANNIYDKPKHKEIVKDYPNIEEYKVEQKDFLNKAYELLNDSNKNSKLYKKRQELSIEIGNYLNNYMNFNNIKFRKMLENQKSSK